MPSVKLTWKGDSPSTSSSSDSLPPILRTPVGLAIIEIQGTIQTRLLKEIDVAQDEDMSKLDTVKVGKLIFPDYDPGAAANSEGGLTSKRAHLYIGKNQRLVGEIKKLPKALAVITKPDTSENCKCAICPECTTAKCEELHVRAIIRYKLLFTSRPEPVSEGPQT